MRSPLLTWSPAVLVVLVVGCSASPTPVCVAGKTAACTCPTGAPGVQACTDTGGGFSACVCEAVDAGVSTCTSATAPDCGTHGACDDTAAGARCSCTAGYSGPRCAQCAPGFQDNAGTGTCRPSCQTVGFSCGAHGACTDTTGTASCSCDVGYTGLTCGGCAAGFQDHDRDGTCEPACTATACGVGGTCSDSSGLVACTCSRGFEGPTCGGCSAGLQDHDQNGTCLPACTSATCGGHGTCADASGTATCTCGTGYTGPDCAQCANGFQDHDGDGTCLPTCATAGLSCGSHASCDDTSGTASCRCLSGFGGPSCAWVGVVKDPGLQNSPYGAWSANAYLLTPGDPGNLEPGVARSPQAIATGASLRQTVSMPPATLAATDAFGLEVSMRSEWVGVLAPAPGGVLRVGGSSAPWSLTTGSWWSSTVCLGEGAFGDGVEVSVAAYPAQPLGVPPNGPNPNTQQHAVDHVEVVPAPGCPTPGVMLDGDFESSPTTGWVLEPGTQASVVANGTVDGSHALRLSSATFCDQPGLARTVVSVPSPGSLAQPALHFRANGTAGKVLQVLSNGFELRDVTLTGAVQQVSVCFADWARGSALPLELALPVDQGTCGNADVRQVDLDGFALVSDPACAPSGPLVNGGFEVSDLGASWVPHFSTPTGGSAAIGTALVHGGAGALQLTATSLCSQPTVRQLLRVPQAVGSAGPAIHVWYSLNQGTAGSAGVVTLGRWSSDPYRHTAVALMPTFGGWGQATLCASGTEGLVMSLDLELLSLSGFCGTVFPATVLTIDDVTVGTDPACAP